MAKFWASSGGEGEGLSAIWRAAMSEMQKMEGASMLKAGKAAMKAREYEKASEAFGNALQIM